MFINPNITESNSYFIGTVYYHIDLKGPASAVTKLHLLTWSHTLQISYEERSTIYLFVAIVHMNTL